MDIGDGADVEAARRLAGEDDARVGERTRPRISFCMLPPDSSRTTAPGRRAFDVVVANDGLGEATGAGQSRKPRAAEGASR